MRADIIDTWLLAQGYSPLTAEQARLLAVFQQHLLDVNTRMNLTAVTGDAEVAVKHFIDSLTLLPWIANGAKIIDVGAGAGFPGLPLKIVRPDICLTLVDSLRKRVLFLQETVGVLGLTDIDCIHARGEELSRKPTHRAAYDLCVARAVARLGTLTGYTLPFLKPGGLLLAMKGPDIAEEIKAAQPALNRYGGKVAEVRTVTIAEGMRHTVVAVEKTGFLVLQL